MRVAEGRLIAVLCITSDPFPSKVSFKSALIPESLTELKWFSIIALLLIHSDIAPQFVCSFIRRNRNIEFLFWAFTKTRFCTCAFCNPLLRLCNSPLQVMFVTSFPLEFWYYCCILKNVGDIFFSTVAKSVFVSDAVWQFFLLSFKHVVLKYCIFKVGTQTCSVNFPHNICREEFSMRFHVLGYIHLQSTAKRLITAFTAN